MLREFTLKRPAAIASVPQAGHAPTGWSCIALRDGLWPDAAHAALVRTPPRHPVRPRLLLADLSRFHEASDRGGRAVERGVAAQADHRRGGRCRHVDPAPARGRRRLAAGGGDAPRRAPAAALPG